MDTHLNEEQLNLKIAELSQELVELKRKKEQLEDAKRKETYF
jgi:hypothetical protein